MLSLMSSQDIDISALTSSMTQFITSFMDTFYYTFMAVVPKVMMVAIIFGMVAFLYAMFTGDRSVLDDITKLLGF